jgi:zinc protease
LHYEVLGNGIEVALKENHQSHALSIQCWVHAGSLHESPQERGMAHFIEHMLFKGTPTREVGEIGRTVEASGGDINAYTTFDRTVFYLTLMSKHAKLGIDLLSDAIFNSTFDQDELESEKKVVLEEISRSEDDPSSKVGRKLFSLCYAGSEAGRPVIGSVESVKSFTRQDVLRFHSKWYQPKNMSVVIVGDFEKTEMMGWLQEAFGKPQSTEIPVIDQPKTTFPLAPFVSLLKDDYKLPKLEIVFPGASMRNFEAVYLDIVSFVLGTGDASRLNKALREDKEVAIACGASSYTPDFDGIFDLSAYVNEDNYLEATKLLVQELFLITTSKPITEKELDRARVNLQSDRLYRDETVEGQARNVGFGLTTEQKIYHEDIYSLIVEKATVEQINSAVRRHFDPARAIIVGLLPKESKLREEEILEAYWQGVNAGKSAPLASSSVKAKSATKKPKTEILQLSNGIKLIYRQSDTPLFALCAATEGGLRSETQPSYGEQNAIGHLLAQDSKSFDHDELVAAVEARGASLGGFSGKDSLGMSLHCLAKDVEPLTDAFFDCLKYPVFTKNQWQLLQNELTETFASQNDSPAGICMRQFQESLFGKHPYGTPVYGTRESTANFDADYLLNKYAKHLKSGPWVLSAIGPEPVAKVKERLLRHVEDWQPQGSKRKFSSDSMLPKQMVEPRFKNIRKEREQSHLVFGYLGIDWYDQDRAALDVMVNILGGHGGRLFVNLREKESLAYTVSPLITYGCHPGVIGSYIACAPEKRERAMVAMRREFDELKSKLVTADEIERAINYIVGTHTMSLQKTDAQAMTTSLMELYGIGYDDFETYPGKIEAVTSADIKRVANRLFVGEGTAIAVGPDL